MSGLAPVRDLEFSQRQHEAAMRAGSKTMLAVLEGRRFAPKGLMWHKGSGVEGRGGAPQREPQRPLAKFISDAELLARTVNRNPCPKCGTRGDLGCKHNPIHLPRDPTAEHVNQAWEREIAAATERHHRSEAA